MARKPSPYDAARLDAFRRPMFDSLSADEIAEFKKIYEEEFKEVISDAEAGIMARNLLELYRILLQKPPEKKSDNEKLMSA